MSHQDQVYLETEANEFFQRCISGLKLDSDHIRPTKKSILNELVSFFGDNISDMRVIEIGCFLGDLLASLQRKYGCKVIGIEPSSLACDYAEETFQLNLVNSIFAKSEYFGCAPDNLSTFDIIILDDVLSWMPRETILPALGSIDWLLKPGGVIYIRDFCPSVDFAYPNHHQKSRGVYNYKVAGGHKKFFLSTGNYVVHRESIRATDTFQLATTNRIDSMTWSDAILMKTFEPIQPRLELGS